MTFNGIDSIIFGVDDMAEGRRYFTDFGLEKTASSRSQTTFETLNGARIILRPKDAKGLPPAIQKSSTIREVVWGVGSARHLARIKRELSKDREVTVGDDGSLHTIDPMGLGIGFRRASPKKTPVTQSPFNAPEVNVRIDRRGTFYKRANPSTISHVVFLAHDYREQERFYTKRLGFHVSDRYRGRGVFLRCSARNSHHNIFFMQSEDRQPKVNHIGFGVRDIHEMFAGGQYLSSRGWKTQIGPGRHYVTSAYFWYFRNPCGGAAEYFCDEDYFTENWKPGSFESLPELFAEWVLDDGLPKSVSLPPARKKTNLKKSK